MDSLTLFNRWLNNDFYMNGSTYKSPAVDVLETPDSYDFFIELPGKTENDINLELKDRILSITANSANNGKTPESESSESEKYRYIIHERKNENISRSFELPKDIDQENIKAEFKNGILLIKIQRKQKEQARKIQITAA